MAASGLWAGLAAGERKKVLIVLDLGSRRLACAKLPINDRFGPRKLRRARSAAAGGRRSVPAAAQACANRLKSHYWFQARGELASCKPLASKRFVLRRTSAPPRRRSHAYLAPTRHCTAGGCFQSMQAKTTAHKPKALKEHSQTSQFITILTTAASCSTSPREKTRSRAVALLLQQHRLHCTPSSRHDNKR